MQNRTDLLNYLVSKHDLKSYCEIGTQNRDQNFDKISCKKKYCVDIDPAAKADFTGSSDEFFKQNKDVYDIYFLDGLHTAEQVKKDFENALKVLSPNGFIVLHDLLPETYERTLVPRPTPTGPWNGDVYKFGIMLSANKQFCTVDIDNGCGVYIGNIPPLYKGKMGAFTWRELVDDKKNLLNLISYNEFVSTYSHF